MLPFSLGVRVQSLNLNKTHTSFTISFCLAISPMLACQNRAENFLENEEFAELGHHSFIQQP